MRKAIAVLSLSLLLLTTVLAGQDTPPAKPMRLDAVLRVTQTRTVVKHEGGSYADFLTHRHY
jgi:hypothetical protein